MAEYYNWEKTLAYDADVTMVVGSRGVGKTFGLRKQFIKDFLRDGSRFCELVRFKNELSSVSDGYFNRLQRLPDFKGYMFKTDSHYAFIAKKPKSKKEKPQWQLIGYFLALSCFQSERKKTFDNVRRIIFDEAILDRSDIYHRYMPNEFGKLTDLVDTISRERSDDNEESVIPKIRPRIYLLGNACDLSNPYFAAYGVGTDLKFGYRWYAGKTFLLHYVDPGIYAKEKAKGTVAGRMYSRTEQGQVSINNEFMKKGKDFIRKKSKNAKFNFGIILNGRKFGVWLDQREGYYYVTGKIPNNTGCPIYALTRNDTTINYVAANKLSGMMRYVSDMYYYKLLRYENESIMLGFYNVLSMFGIR